MKLLTFSLAVAGVLLVASCSNAPVSPTPQEKFPGCPDPIHEALPEGESSTAKTPDSPDSGTEQPTISERYPDCTLPELNEK